MTAVLLACVLVGYTVQLPTLARIAAGSGALQFNTFDIFGPRWLGQVGNLFTLGTVPSVNGGLAVFFFMMMYKPFQQEVELCGQALLDDSRLTASMAFAVFQTFLIVRQVLAVHPGTPFALAAALFVQLLAGWAVFDFICQTISKEGLGDGTFNVIALNIVIEFLFALAAIAAGFLGGRVAAASVAALVAGVALFAAAVAAIVRAEEKVPIRLFKASGAESAARQQVQKVPEISLKYCGFGIMPLILSEIILGGTFVGMQWTGLSLASVAPGFTRQLQTNLLVLCAAKAALLLPVCLLYGLLSYKQKYEKMATALQHLGGQVEDVNPGLETQRYLLDRQLRVNTVGSVVFTRLATVATAAQHVQRGLFGVELNLISLMLLMSWVTQFQRQVRPHRALEASHSKVRRFLDVYRLSTREAADPAGEGKEAPRAGH